MPPSTCCSFCCGTGARLLIERAGLAAVAAVDLLLVLLRAAEAARLLIERARLAAVAAPSTCCSFCCVPPRPPACSLNAPVWPP